jgi:hypothetical protein
MSFEKCDATMRFLNCDPVAAAYVTVRKACDWFVCRATNKAKLIQYQAPKPMTENMES